MSTFVIQDAEEENDKYNHMQDFEQQRSNSVKTTFSAESRDEEGDDAKDDNNASRYEHCGIVAQFKFAIGLLKWMLVHRILFFSFFQFRHYCYYYYFVHCRLNLGVSGKNLSRKRGFKVVPYASSFGTFAAPTSPSSSSYDMRGQFSNQRADSDRQLNIVPLSTRDEARRKRREAAMNRSKLAHEYRVAKNCGDDKAMRSSKSLLNLLGKSKSKRLCKSVRYNNNASGVSSNAEDEVSQAEKNKDMDDFLDLNAEQVSDKSNPDPESSPAGGHGKSANNLANSSFGKRLGLQPRVTSGRSALAESDDSDTGEIVSDSDFDEHDDDDDDDDYGTLDEPIQQLDGGALDAMFDDIVNSATQSKCAEENSDLVEWNHVMVGKAINHSLIAPVETTNLDLEIKVSKCESIVSRSYMEDRTYACVSEPGSGTNGCCPLAVCAVFDGHNGSYVSQLLQDKFASTFTTLLRAAELKPDFHSSNHSSTVVNIIEEASALIDAEVLRSDYVRQLQTIKTGIQDVQSFAGSAAVMAAIMPCSGGEVSSTNRSPRSTKNGNDAWVGKIQVFVAHVGDCRAVLCNDGVAVQLTIDHKPATKTEKARIETAGGWVHNGRVNGSLGVSRAFGDIQFKVFTETPGFVNGEENLMGSIWAPNQQVISKPEVKHFVVDRPFEFIILACDGLWDVFDCQEAVNFVRKRLSVTRNVEKTAQELIQKAIKRGTQDNTSVVIVTFHQHEISLM